jgi:hypothetical protein
MSDEIHDRMIALRAQIESLLHDLPDIRSGTEHWDACVARYLHAALAAFETPEPSRKLAGAIHALARLAVDELPAELALSVRIGELSGVHQSIKRAERRLHKNAP